MRLDTTTKRKRTKRKRPRRTVDNMTSSFDREKRVSFGDSTNTIHFVENYKLSLDTPSQHKKVWYGPEEMHKFYEDECVYQEKRAAAKAYKAACRPRRNSYESQPKSPSRSPTTSPSLTSPTRRELNQQQTQAIRNLRLAASTQYSNFLARNQQRSHHNVNRMTRSTSEALAATRLPSRQQHPQRYRRHSRKPEIGRVREVFYSE